MVYRCGDVPVSEDLIGDTTDAVTPVKRLFDGIVSPIQEYELRRDLLRYATEIAASPVRGFVGGRIQLLGHQLFIASEVSSRKIVRALLADETGLGKTIEACLILHRLLVSERICRVLILVPDHLVHQWFVELLRRFNLSFGIVAKEYCDTHTKADNPFTDDPRILCSIDYLAQDSFRAAQAMEASWDLVIADEAHHLLEQSTAYSIVKRLSETTSGLLLLTATPEQLGRRDHFTRLKLLDPYRYTSFEEYVREVDHIADVSHCIERALQGRQGKSSADSLDDLEISVPETLVSSRCKGAENTGDFLKSTKTDTGRVTMNLKRFIDIYGTGRIMFRNTRHIITGFPHRLVHIEPLIGSESDRERLRMEFRADTGGVASVIAPLSGNDLRIDWLMRTIQKLPHEKFLVIATTKEKATGLYEAITRVSKIKITLFHEGMTIVQRDRNAAWFTEEHGARLLVSSEIGSEGRNFQFCRHLVLFDLPLSPELIEQRIGRLDRIGQRSQIFIHVPYIEATPAEVVCRVFHHGLDLFNHNVPAAAWVFADIRESLMSCCRAESPGSAVSVEALITRARTLCDHYTKSHFQARDNLFELASSGHEKTEPIVDAIVAHDNSLSTGMIMSRLLKQYGIAIEDAGENKQILLTEYVTDQGFPLPRSERPVITYDRATALSREDVEFITIDHPMLTGALELFLSAERGTTAFSIWDNPSTGGFLLETKYVLECIAPPALECDRFLPPVPLRIVIDQPGHSVGENYPVNHPCFQGTNGSAALLSRVLENGQSIITSMVEKSSEAAQTQAHRIIEKALQAMHRFFKEEMSRLEFCANSGGAMIRQELQRLSQENKELDTYLRESSVRLDALHLVLGSGFRSRNSAGIR
jgi:ATP-dependent helicase HepA